MTRGGHHEHAQTWTEEEDRLICHLRATEGPQWSKMTAHMPGRSAASIRNRWQRMEAARKVREQDEAASGPIKQTNWLQRLKATPGVKADHLRVAEQRADELRLAEQRKALEEAPHKRGNPFGTPGRDEETGLTPREEPKRKPKKRQAAPHLLARFFGSRDAIGGADPNGGSSGEIGSEEGDEEGHEEGREESGETGGEEGGEEGGETGGTPRSNEAVEMLGTPRTMAAIASIVCDELPEGSRSPLERGTSFDVSELQAVLSKIGADQ